MISWTKRQMKNTVFLEKIGTIYKCFFIPVHKTDGFGETTYCRKIKNIYSNNEKITYRFDGRFEIMIGG